MKFKGAARPLAVAIPAVGVHNVYNALAAAAICEELGIEPGEIAERLGGVRLPPMRMEISVKGGITVINDAYNANPASARAALETLKGMTAAGKKIVVMGEMLELGAVAERAHREIGRTAAECGVDLLVAVGGMGALVVEGARRAGMLEAGVVLCADVRDVASVLQERAEKGDCVLLKASRRVGLERVLEYMPQ